MELAEKAGLIYSERSKGNVLAEQLAEGEEGFPDTDSPVWIMGRELSAKYGRGEENGLLCFNEDLILRAVFKRKRWYTGSLLRPSVNNHLVV